MAVGINQRSWGPQGLRRRAELMEAAVTLAGKNGFGRTRVSDIVGRVGVGQGAFYWYFDSKDALFREILADTTLRLRRYQAAWIAGEEDPVRRIAKGIVATIDFIAHNLHAFSFLDHASMQARRKVQRTQASRVHVFDTVRHIEEAAAAGIVRKGDATALSEGIAGVVDRFARTYFAVPRPDVDSVAQEAVDFCLGGITGSRTLDVCELRADVSFDDVLLEVRDRVGAGGIPPAP